MVKKRHRSGTAALAPDDIEARVGRALQEGRTQQALELAKQLVKHDNTLAHRELLLQAYLERARHLRSQGYDRDAQTVLDNAVQLGTDDPGWVTKLVKELAACGHVPRVMSLLDRLPDAGVRAQLLAQAVDRALEQGAAGRVGLPPALQASYDLVLRAFSELESGQDAQARETLQGIGLQSPFLEWKVMLRGLLAFYHHDDVRAVENWQRLSPERLPARLVAPLRVAIDPSYRVGQPPAAQVVLQKQADRLQGSGLAEPLRMIQKALADDNQLHQALRLADNLVPALRHEAPQLVARLAACFYWAIVLAGESGDWMAYRRVFGAPPDDPDLDRLQALSFEHMSDYSNAHKHWQRFDLWAAGNPDVFPGDQARRVRALVWDRMANNAASIPDSDKLLDLPPFLRDHPAWPKPLVPSAEQCLQRSLELAPDRLEGYEHLLQFNLKEEKFDKAEEIARRLLTCFPEHGPTLEALGDLLIKKQDYAEALTLFQQALHANPLERSLREKVGTAHLLKARAQVEKGQFAEARLEYQANLALFAGEDKSSALCKWAACEFKAGNAGRGEELLHQALAHGSSRLPVVYSILIETLRLNLAGQLKTRFNKEFNRALAEKPSAADAVATIDTAAAHRQSGVTYHGQKTHEKKVFAYLERVAKEEFSEEQLENICSCLLDLAAGKKVRSWVRWSRQRFPHNPSFPLAEAESYIMQGPRLGPLWKVQELLETAGRLARAMPAGDKQQHLLQEIEKRQRLLPSLRPAGPDVLGELFKMFGMPQMDEDTWFGDEENEDLEDAPFSFFGSSGQRKRPRRR